MATPDVRPQEARWRTVSLPVELERVREALGAAVKRGKSLPGLIVQGLPTRDGFVLECVVGRKRVGAELVLAEWDGGTQIQLVVPSDEKPTRPQLQRLFGWLELVLAENGWRAE